MKRTQTIFISIAAAVCVFLPACRKEESGVAGGEAGRVPILFNVSTFDAQVSTKAVPTEVTTANLTQIYVTASRGTVGASTEAATFTSASFTGTSGNAFRGDKWWPYSDPSYHFYASNISNSFSSGVCTVSASSSTDVVCAYIASPTYKTSNTLTFKHIFARIGTVTVNSPSGYTLSGASVKITPKTSGTYNIRTGNGQTDGTGWSATSNGSETTLSASDNKLYTVPGNYDLTVTYTLTKGDWNHQYTKTATVDLSAGSTNNISMTPPPGSAEEIIVGLTLTAWGTNNITDANFQ